MVAVLRKTTLFPGDPVKRPKKGVAAVKLYTTVTSITLPDPQFGLHWLVTVIFPCIPLARPLAAFAILLGLVGSVAP